MSDLACDIDHFNIRLHNLERMIIDKYELLGEQQYEIEIGASDSLMLSLSKVDDKMCLCVNVIDKQAKTESGQLILSKAPRNIQHKACYYIKKFITNLEIELLELPMRVKAANEKVDSLIEFLLERG